jgi:hypothetical protein
MIPSRARPTHDPGELLARGRCVQAIFFIGKSQWHLLPPDFFTLKPREEENKGGHLG